ncbi:DUF305 domain-containing protein [Amnibacterium flavum]|uniref:DUF305 domain-containing protein n=1 Tax=Amnibacterium flavum TaxID=2173173 RepID=A0A2V1HT05_9MICO|nr:DUF305 domain-containing protein [Amnibacterium flavum]PVZ93214.1 DUF305 domain-containing protein [Amnibacterium flavum]
MKKRTILLATAGLATTLILSGCANGGGAGMAGMDHGGSSSSAPTATSEAGATFNDADTSFAMEMVAHHQGAIEMSDVLLAKEGIDVRVVELAQTIKAAQTPEIETMNSWLEEWGAEGDMSGMDHGGMMMSEEDMAALEAATGTDAARLFLEQMTMHHEGAIDMAQTELDNGQNEDALALAQKIIDDQTAEIATMQDLLTTL